MITNNYIIRTDVALCGDEGIHRRGGRESPPAGAPVATPALTVAPVHAPLGARAATEQHRVLHSGIRSAHGAARQGDYVTHCAARAKG